MNVLPACDCGEYAVCLLAAVKDVYIIKVGVLQKLLAAKRKSVRAESEYELNGKLVRFALSRGFEMKDICRCIEVSEENDYSE